MFDLSDKRVWVAGHRGMLGSAIVRRLRQQGTAVVGTDGPRVDLRRQLETERLVNQLRPDVVVVAAAHVGGILANSRHPVEFLYDNLMIEANVIRAAAEANVAKLLFLGSSCIYPKLAEQPIDERALLTGALEATNEWYAVAKIAGIKLTQAYRAEHQKDFIAAMPTNLYGPGDNFDLSSSHVLPALIRKAHDAKRGLHPELTIWGTGSPRREFLHVDDCADALVFLLSNYSDSEHINVGFGKDLTILELAETVCEVVGFDGKISLDDTRPDGTPRKLMSNRKLDALGWHPKIALKEGIRSVYEWYKATYT